MRSSSFINFLFFYRTKIAKTVKLNLLPGKELCSCLPRLLCSWRRAKGRKISLQLIVSRDKIPLLGYFHDQTQEACQRKWRTSLPRLFCLFSSMHSSAATSILIESSLTTVEAESAIFCKQFRKAEMIYMDHGRIDCAIEMYRRLFKWDEALKVGAFRAVFSCCSLRRSPHFTVSPLTKPS